MCQKLIPHDKNTKSDISNRNILLKLMFAKFPKRRILDPENRMLNAALMVYEFFRKNWIWDPENWISDPENYLCLHTFGSG